MRNPFKITPKALSLLPPLKNNSVIKIPEAKYTKPQMLRQPSFTIVVGKQYIGKSFISKIKADKCLKGNTLTGTKPRKVLYFDINGEYKSVKTIPVDYAFGVPNENGIVVDSKTRTPIINWISIFSSPRTKVEARRVVMTKSNGSLMNIEEINIVLEYILKYFTGGLLIVEDPTYYISDTPDRDLTGTLARIRHKNCDIICHFQYKSKALNPRLWNNASFIRIHKTEDNFRDYKNRMKGERRIVYLAEILEKQENKKLLINATKEQLANIDKIPIETFYCTIHKKRTKICGDFSPNAFYSAVETYILQNKKDALFELVAEVNKKTGKSKYTFEEQLKIKADELFREYYGNQLLNV